MLRIDPEGRLDPEPEPKSPNRSLPTSSPSAPPELIFLPSEALLVPKTGPSKGNRDPPGVFPWPNPLPYPCRPGKLSVDPLGEPYGEAEEDGEL